MNQEEKQENAHLYAVFAIMATLFTYAAVMMISAASVNKLADHFKVTDTTLSSIFRLFMAGFLCAAIFGGRISDRTRKMPVVASGCAFMAVGMLMFCKATHFAILPYAALIAGLGGGLAEVVGTALISDLYSGPRRTAMMNWLQVVFAAGAVASPLLFGHLLKLGINWRQGYLAVTLLCIAAALLAASASKSVKRQVESLDEQVSQVQIMLNPKVLQLSFGLLLYVGSEVGIVFWIAKYMEKDLLATPDMAAKSVAALWVGLGVGRWIATRLPSLMTDKNIIRWSLLLSVIITAMLLCAKHPTAGLALTFCAGVPLGPVWPTIVSRAGYLFPKQSGSVIGIVASVGCVGATTIPSVIGVLSDIVGIRMALWTSVIGLALSLLIMMIGKKSGQDCKSSPNIVL
ncbi:MAG: MFS transporter [Armatimonadetes bacterium]|nr:MFS transporter [Armatimonadota bacterium]